MLMQDLVSRVSRRLNLGTPAQRLREHAGKAQPHPASPFEALEPRILLSGDHPGIDDVFGPSNTPPTVITITGADQDLAFGEIGDVPNDTGDFFQFTANQTGFVSVFAQTIGAGLDSALELYSPDGTKISGANEGLDNGTTARGLDSDGWLGFIATAGETYYLRVLGQSGTTGDYVVHLNTINTNLTLDTDTGYVRTGSGTNDFETIDTLQQDRIYAFTTPDLEKFNSLGSILAGDIAFGDTADGFVANPLANRDILDTRVELFDAEGNLIGADSSSGYLNDGFLITRFERNMTYYVRVRSDAFEPTTETDPQTGTPESVADGRFELRIQAAATDFPLDPVTRLGVIQRAPDGSPLEVGLLRDQHSAQIFAFDSLGTGDTIINFFSYGVSLAGIVRGFDPKIALYDEDGLVPLATNDSAINSEAFDRAEIQIALQGGKRYYVVVDAFDGPFFDVGDDPRDLRGAAPSFVNPSQEIFYHFVIESNVTLDLSDLDQVIDDHIDFITDDDGLPLNANTVRDLATPLVWGDPFTPFGFVDAADYFDRNGDGQPDSYLGFTGGAGLSALDFVNTADDHVQVVQAHATGRLDNSPGRFGVADSDVFMFVPQIDHLGAFTGGQALDMDGEELDPPEWAEDGRPAGRITIVAQFEFEWFPIGTTAVQIYDSNFQFITEAPIESINDFSNDPSGLDDPSLLGPNPTEYGKVEAAVTLDTLYWGGEAYYIVITGPGSRTRYSLAVQSETDQDTRATDYADASEAPEEGDFGDAEELIFGINTGLATNTGNPAFTGERRVFETVNNGILDPMEDGFFNRIEQTGELGNISRIDDTDVYKFVAPKNGTAEIILSTTQITDTYNERFINTNTGATVDGGNSLTKTYNSPLDAAIRIYDSNGNQIAYINDYLGFNAEGTVIPFGNGSATVGDVVVFRKDPRIVLNVLQGQEYFVVIESSQRYSGNADAANPDDRDPADPSTVDWRVAIGSYQLIVNATPQNVADDHSNIFGNFSETVIPFDSDPTSPGNGTGFASGSLTLNDFDNFAFMAPTDGLVTVTLDPSAALSAVITVRDGNGNQIFIPNNTAIGGEALTISFSVEQSERYNIRVFGLNGSGTYTLALSGLPVSDDVADEGRFFAATELDFGQFSRSATASGLINQGGDSDIYTFEAAETDLATITLERQTGQASMLPAVIVYELGQDNAATPMPVNHVIAWDLNPLNAGRISIDFSTQAGRKYFIVVKGADPSNSVGGYNLTVEFDPEDDHADIGQLDDATFVNIVPSTGNGSATGLLEQSNDSDLFVFGVPTTGPTDISLVWDTQPGASFEIRLFDIDGNRIYANGVVATYTSSSGFLAVPQFTGNTADIFYVAVVGPTATRIDYTLNINTGIVDDHANDTGFAEATEIPLNLDSGDGSAEGRLEVDDDTDFFTFEILANGLFTIDVAQGNIGTLQFRLYDESQTLISHTQVDANTISFNNAAGANARYYLSVGSTFPGIRTGSYTLSIDGPPVAPDPNDDHANQGNLSNATVLNVNNINGNASDTGIINTVTDTDLFRYTTIGRGELFIQVFTPDSPNPDFTVRIFDASGTEITDLANATGVPGTTGVTAATSFFASGAGQTFYILVDSTGDVDTGNFNLRVDGPAQVTRTYYPEGFANANIHEFISLANPNDEDVSYSITVYYADPNLGSAVVATGILAAGARGGTTLSFGRDINNDGNADFAPGIIANEAYAIVVESTLRLGASLSHYDANLARSGSIGEAFTDITANRWDFPDVTRNPGVVEDFLVWYNPNSFDVTLTITAFTSNGSEIVLNPIVLGANKRGGLEIHNTSTLPLGTFAIEITSTPVDSANNDANVGIVAALSRYDLINRFAFGYLGVRDGGSTVNIIASLTNGTDIQSEFSIFNSGDTDATITITGSYLEDPGLPDLVRQVTVAAGRRLRLTGTDLAFVANEPLGLRITSSVDVAISAIERQRGDANAAAAFTEAGTSFYFGDAFMNPLRAGNIYTESLAFYNPSDTDAEVTITFFFADGAAERVRMETVAAEDFLLLRLENLTQVIQNRPQLNYYAMRIDSTTGIVVAMTHYDSFLGGGWGTGGAPLGLTSSIA